MQPPSQNTPSNMTRSSRLRRLGWVLLLAIFAVTFWQRQNLVDWWLLRDYDPPIKVAALATDTTMTEYARKVFYINKPQVQDKAAFYISCEEGETTIVLGCYKPPHGIYLLKVSDERLAGVEEVTAAHELLHAVYDRLSDGERARISNLVEQAYAALKNSSVAEKLALYEASGADTTNELHSILGTEIADLPAELEAHYAKYFSERTKIVALSDQYQAVFTARKKRVAELDQQIASLEQQIIANNTALTAERDAINAEAARLDTLLQRGQVSEYNQGVAPYNQRIAAFRTKLAAHNAQIAQYNNIFEDRNSVAQEAQELSKALDSRIQTTVDDL